MAVGRELFKLWGVLGMQGVEKTQKQLRGIDKQARRAQKAIDRLGRSVSDTGKVLTKLFTVPLLAAAAASVKFVDDATDLNETISKTGEIFGESAKDIEKWAETSATGIGQSKSQAMDAASTFAIFGRSAGLAGKDLVKFSTEFVELSSDMASFFNTEPAEAITAIGAAFRGETEPIRRYGVLLDDATMRQTALELGIVTTIKKALTPQNKVLAAQALIMKQTSIAQGDFARTSAGLANQKRILAAQLKNVSASLGQLFLPTALKVGKLVSRLIGLTERLVEAWKKLNPETKRTIIGFVLIAGALGPVVFALGKIMLLGKLLIPVLVGLKTATSFWGASLVTIKTTAMSLTIVIGALVALGWYWYSQWDTMSVQLAAVWAKIRLFIAKGVNAIVQGVTDGMLAIIDVVSKVGKVIPGLTEKLNSAKREIFLFKAAMYKDIGKQEAYKNSINAQAKATDSLTESLKKAIDAGKEALGIKDEDIAKTKTQIKLKEELKDKESLQWEAARDAARRRLEFEQSIQLQLDEMNLSEIEKLAVQREEALSLAEQFEADKFRVIELYAQKEKELKDQLRKDEQKKSSATLRRSFRETTKIGNAVNNILSRFSDNRINRLDIEAQKQIAGIQNSKMAEEDKATAIQEIEEQTEKKRRKLERQRAIREKLAALFNIAINTASAVVEALPNIPLAIAVGLLGAAEGLSVATAPMPFEEGGLVQGSEQGIHARVGESNQDELVLPLERGIGLFIDGLIERLNEIELPTFGAPELAGAAADTSTIFHLNVGTLIADDRGVKELERRLNTFRIAENQRKGI